MKGRAESDLSWRTSGALPLATTTPASLEKNDHSVRIRALGQFVRSRQPRPDLAAGPQPRRDKQPPVEAPSSQRISAFG